MQQSAHASLQLKLVLCFAFWLLARGFHTCCHAHSHQLCMQAIMKPFFSEFALFAPFPHDLCYEPLGDQWKCCAVRRLLSFVCCFCIVNMHDKNSCNILFHGNLHLHVQVCMHMGVISPISACICTSQIFQFCMAVRRCAFDAHSGQLWNFKVTKCSHDFVAC